MSSQVVEVKEQMCKTETIKLRNKLIGRSCQLFYRNDPLKIVRGKGQYLYDENGTEYLDCINNVAHVGHCHPRVVEAGTRQMASLSTNNRFLHDELVKCAEKLVSKMPGNLSVCYFVNSGSEANDLALRLARTHTKQQDVITLDHAYHGHLTSVMEISPYKFNLPGADPKPSYTHVAPCPDDYRGKYTKFVYNEDDLGKLYAEEVEDIITGLAKNGKGVAAFIAESLQSCGGQILPPKDYFKRVYSAVRAAGGVTIADEVQVGFGRCGTHYWAFEPYGVVPDIVTVAKPMGNGHPVAAVVVTPEIAHSFTMTGVQYFNTYGGNPVSCAIANAVMDVVDDEQLQQHALSVGQYIFDNLEHKMKNEFEIIGDVRGTGLFVGIELVYNRYAPEPATKAAKWVVDRMKNVHKILVSSDGPDDNVVKLKPPMVFNKTNADQFLTAFRECLSTWQLQNQELEKPVNTSQITSSTNCTIPTKLPERKHCLIKSV